MEFEFDVIPDQKKPTDDIDWEEDWDEEEDEYSN